MILILFYQIYLMLSKTLLSIYFSVIILSRRKKNHRSIQQGLKDFRRFSPQLDDARVFACFPRSVFLDVAITFLKAMLRGDEKSRILFYFITNQGSVLYQAEIYSCLISFIIDKRLQAQSSKQNLKLTSYSYINVGLYTTQNHPPPNYFFLAVSQLPVIRSDDLSM